MHKRVCNCVKSRHFDILSRAEEKSDALLKQAGGEIDAFLSSAGQTSKGLCFAVIGSVGRMEALEASDLDLIPIAVDEHRLAEYLPFDQNLRAHLMATMHIKVSKGSDLTKATHVAELVDPETIGGAHDSSGALTKRVLLLTESAQAGGDLPINDIREALLDAYSTQRTSGRHVLALCNDISRYYKTLCVEYKSKIDEQGLDWCTRNVKLRHSRKIWFFSNMMTVASLADDHPQGEEQFKEALLLAFNMTPIARLAETLGDTQPLALGSLLESYSMFLDFMSNADNRKALSEVEHDKRYEMTLGNPFPMMKFNSDLIHTGIMAIIEDLGISRRSRIMGWFML